MTYTDMSNKVHEGHNIKRFREMLGIKQDALAFELGEDWNQKKISLLESKETVDPEILEQVAKALKVPAEAIKNFDEETAIHNIQNNYEGSVIHGGPTVNYKCTINPMDKWLEAMDENKKLYERLLQTEREKVEMLEKLLSEKKGK
ncbi:Helix-turn-helix domain-containing protein [Chitinophaga eiseniae]|uniref:Helix-turn-helix domain-containing protein n=1 Tax=Chitinophaga eiseniae TaxID=634771 RepID=A0A1T4QSH3_9BACT|nr:helix-turn-helix transcriptional regulator [Chitinophaga eiseniae]SKA06670.1 Helix-turn-helix domain-containing protein [Chitinophaga eiseniae]